MAGIYNDGKYLMMVRSENESEGPGDLSFVSSKTEIGAERYNPLEETAHREIMKEVGITVPDLVYVCSRTFTLSRGPNLFLAEFLWRWEPGIAYAADPDEVESVAWMTPEEVQDTPNCHRGP